MASELITYPAAIQTIETSSTCTMPRHLAAHTTDAHYSCTAWQLTDTPAGAAAIVGSVAG
jgi:hypothetical protein